jgi:hypothetical protein
MIKKSIVLFLALPATVLANGSPIDGSAIHATGNIQPAQYRDIGLEEETLAVTLKGDHAEVVVNYLLVNHGPATTITYGFPVQRMSDYARQDLVPSAATNVDSFTMRDNGNLLSVQSSAKPDPVSADEFKEILWHVAKLAFAKAERKKLRVSYTVKNFLDDWVTSKDFRPSFSDRTFSYTLRPSGNWGNGVVKNLTITVDAREILAGSGEIVEIKPAGFRKKDGIISWQLANISLKNLEDLVIRYQNNAAKGTEDILRSRLPQQAIAGLTASSTLIDGTGNSYGPENLFDGDLSTAWCVPFEKNKGARLTITLKHATFFGVGIVNGYTKSEKAFLANSRAKEIHYSDDATTMDSISNEALAELEDRRFQDLNIQAFAPSIDWLMTKGDTPVEAKNVTIEIIDSYPGSVYKDLCISELYIYGSVSDKP